MNVLTLQCDSEGEWLVVDQDGETRYLREFLADFRRLKHLTTGRVTTEAGLLHPGYSKFEQGRTKTLRALPNVLDVLGLELQIVDKAVR